MSIIDTSSTAAPQAKATGFSALGSDDFAKIIFAELSKQDPLQPNDTNALIQQISGIRSIQSNMDLSTQLKSLVSQNEFSSAAGLMGKLVTGLTDNAYQVSGVVKGIGRSSDGAILTLADGTQIRFSNVQTIAEAPAVNGVTPPDPKPVTPPVTPPVSPIDPPTTPTTKDPIGDVTTPGTVS